MSYEGGSKLSPGDDLPSYIFLFRYKVVMYWWQLHWLTVAQVSLSLCLLLSSIHKCFIGLPYCYSLRFNLFSS